MIKRNNKNTSISTLREEVNDVHIEYRAYLLNIKTIFICITICLAIAGFFGYDKIDNIENRMIARLTATDSILGKIDTSRIFALNKKIKEKEVEYSKTLEGLEKMILMNKNIEERILSLLPNNLRVERDISIIYEKGVSDLFEIRGLKSEYRSTSTVFLYLIFNDNIDLSSADCLNIRITGKNHLFKNYYYKLEQNFNKLNLTMDIPKGEYEIVVGYMTLKESQYTLYRATKNIKII